jgi:hypothetical protein
MDIGEKAAAELARARTAVERAIMVRIFFVREHSTSNVVAEATVHSTKGAMYQELEVPNYWYSILLHKSRNNLIFNPVTYF